MKESVNKSGLTDWQLVGWVTLSIRFIQGWIFWAGGSRRFIYAPSKLDPSSKNWLANKLQSAMPGAILGAGHVISYLLNHFWLLYTALILFSFIELISGLGLIFGLFTRLSAFLTAMISVILMVSFGWQGGTCLDEWTMAVSNFAMAIVLLLSGAPVYSLDNWLLRKYPYLKTKQTFIALASGVLATHTLKRAAIFFLLITILFATSTYNYYRGAIFSPYHAGPVSPTSFELSLSQGQINSQGNISFILYVSGGTTAVPAYIISAELLSANDRIMEWTMKDLSELKSLAIVNQYPYNQITAGSYGLVAPVGAKAKITLELPNRLAKRSEGDYRLQLITIDGKKWTLSI